MAWSSWHVFLLIDFIPFDHPWILFYSVVSVGSEIGNQGAIRVGWHGLFLFIPYPGPVSRLDVAHLT